MQKIDHAVLPEANGKYLIRKLSGSTDYDHCISGYGDSYINMPNPIPFLEKGVLAEIGRYFFLHEEVMEELYLAASMVKKNRLVLCYTWHIYYRLISLSFSSGASHAGFGDWFLPESEMGEYTPCVTALVGMGALALARSRYRAEGYPEDIIRDTLGVYTDGFNRAVKAGRKPTISLAALNWMRVYLSTRLVELGRFNFKLMESNPFGVVLKNRKDGRKLMLAEKGTIYNGHGYCLQENDPWEEGKFAAVYNETSDAYTGNPISPAGYALKTVKSYPKAEWEKILESGDIMIDMHIPGGGGMTPEKALASFRKAAAFFAGRYPGRFHGVFICHSWIFNTQFEDKLPDSNLAKLMRECYLFPHSSNGKDGLFFLFPKLEEDLSKLPRDTSVRRAALEILDSGERLRTGGMILFVEDLETFGTGYYRRTFQEE